MTLSTLSMRLVPIILVLLVPLCAWPLSEVDERELADVSTPASLNIIRSPETVQESLKVEGAQAQTQATTRAGSLKRQREEPIQEKDIEAIAMPEDVSETEHDVRKINKQSYSIEHPDGSRMEWGDAYRFIIKSGDTEMRDTFIQQRGAEISPGSWVDIKPR
ncbi:MAG TPA: hypothetical protein PLS81_07970 [Deltaproteobacteria bacterium]|nr:hypothetical protein [Deltaproteobacteria bacterium]HPP81704.1 hypothetical protein [Deltaproteobacteria bacterium]